MQLRFPFVYPIFVAIALLSNMSINTMEGERLNKWEGCPFFGRKKSPTDVVPFGKLSDLHTAVISEDVEEVREIIEQEQACFQDGSVNETVNFLPPITGAATPLIYACSDFRPGRIKAKKKIIRLLLEAGADPNKCMNFCGEKIYPLHCAAQEGNRDACHILLQHGAQVNLQDDAGFAPLHCAVSCKTPFAEVVSILLTYNANPELETNLKRTVKFTPYEFAAMYKRLDLARLIIDWTRPDRDSLLCKYVTMGDLAKTERLLNLGANINQKDPSTRFARPRKDTVLHVAVMAHNIEMVQLLLMHKPNVDTQNERGETPLHESVWLGNYAITELLLENDASTAIANMQGETPLQLMGAHIHIQDMLNLLLQYGADINAQCSLGNTILSNACRKNDYEFAEMLLKKPGINLNLYNHTGLTALGWACYNQSIKMVKLLLEHGVRIVCVVLQDPQAAHLVIEQDGLYVIVFGNKVKINNDIVNLLTEYKVL